MKKVLALIIGIWFVMPAMQAQTLSFGPEIGVNFNKFSTNESGYNSSFKPGFRVGMNLNIPVARRSFIGTGFYFNQKGQTRVYTEGGMDRKEYLNMDYFQVPLNYVHRFKVNNAGSLLLMGGIYVGYGFNGRQRIYGYDSLQNSNELVNSNISWGQGGNQYNPFDMGLNIGLSYEIPFGLYVKALYAQGMMPISNNDLNNKYHNNIQLCLGLNFWTWIN